MKKLQQNDTERKQEEVSSIQYALYLLSISPSITPHR